MAQKQGPLFDSHEYSARHVKHKTAAQTLPQHMLVIPHPCVWPNNVTLTLTGQICAARVVAVVPHASCRTAYTGAFDEFPFAVSSCPTMERVVPFTGVLALPYSPGPQL